MVQQKQNIQQNIQPPFASRNPHMRPQYQQQQAPLIQKQYSGHMKQQQIYDNPDQFDQPQIEPDFQPEIPMTNSVLNQSKIPFQQNQVRITPGYNPQVQANPPYVVPRRNPNINLKQYDNAYGGSHFVNTADPGLSTITVKYKDNSSIQNNNSSDIVKKISGQLSQKSSGRVQNSLDNEPIEQPEVGTGTSNFGPNVELSETQNVKQSGLDNIGLSGMKSVEPITDSKINEEFEKENPIEEKFPDQSHVDDLNNQNEGFPQQMSQNPSQIGDIDDNLDHLPTINSIMKGNSEMLPPPKKKKYH